MAPIGLYPEDLDPEIIFFQWTGSTKMYHIYLRLFKEGNHNQNYLKCLDLQDNNIEVLLTDITLDKIKLACADTVELKPTRNDVGFIT